MDSVYSIITTQWHDNSNQWYAFDNRWHLVSLYIFTHRRSIAEHSTMHVSAASVCLFVSLFTHTITSERCNVRWWNFVVRCTVQKCRPCSNVKVTRDKNMLTADTPWVHTNGMRSLQAAAVDGPISWLPQGCCACSCVVRSVYAGGKISACCLVISNPFTHRYL